MKAWIARDSEGRCEVFCNEPKLVKDEYEENGTIYPIQYWSDEEASILEITLDESFHPEVTFNNSPQYVTLSESDILCILRKKRDNIIEENYKTNQVYHGIMFMPELSMDMGKIYILNNIISLLEIDERKRVKYGHN